MNEAQSRPAPLVKQVTVPWPVEVAFRRFTHGIHDWWPLTTHSVFRERAKACTIEVTPGGRFYETSESGEESVWGTVLEVDEPARLRFTWHPDRTPDTAQEVEVRFQAEGTGTRVILTHTGWDKLGDKAGAMRARYNDGWEGVLARFRDEKETD